MNDDLLPDEQGQLSDTVFLSVVVILLLVEMSCFYVHVSNGSLMISSVAMLVLIIMNFCITFIVVLGMMIGLLLSSWWRFFVSGMTILEYSLVMAEGCQRQNWTVYCHMLHHVVLNFYFFLMSVLYFEYDFT